MLKEAQQVVLLGVISKHGAKTEVAQRKTHKDTDNFLLSR
jgi:hypothetical protein